MKKKLFLLVSICTFTSLVNANEIQVKTKISPTCRSLIVIQEKAYNKALKLIQEQLKRNLGEIKDEAALKAWDLMGETYMDVHSICGGKNPLFE